MIVAPTLEAASLTEGGDYIVLAMSMERSTDESEPNYFGYSDSLALPLILSAISHHHLITATFDISRIQRRCSSGFRGWHNRHGGGVVAPSAANTVVVCDSTLVLNQPDCR